MRTITLGSVSTELPTDKELSEMSVFGLAGWHQACRKEGYYISCIKIEQEVAKRGIIERVLITKLNGYKPIPSGELELR